MRSNRCYIQYVSIPLKAIIIESGMEMSLIKPNMRADPAEWKVDAEWVLMICGFEPRKSHSREMQGGRHTTPGDGCDGGIAIDGSRMITEGVLIIVLI